MNKFVKFEFSIYDLNRSTWVSWYENYYRWHVFYLRCGSGSAHA